MLGNRALSKTHFIESIDTTPEAFPHMFTGRGIGKMVAWLA